MSGELYTAQVAYLDGHTDTVEDVANIEEHHDAHYVLNCLKNRSIFINKDAIKYIIMQLKIA